jgi:hypothetical protein
MDLRLRLMPVMRSDLRLHAMGPDYFILLCRDCQY